MKCLKMVANKYGWSRVTRESQFQSLFTAQNLREKQTLSTLISRKFVKY